MKPPLNTKSSNDFQTPPNTLNPLYPYLNKEWTIWECASGKGNLSNALINKGFAVCATDKEFDFLKRKPDVFDCIITNPPFSLKQEFLQRAYELGKPFAFLLPLTTFETAKRQELFSKYGLEVIFFDRRINFETPNKVAKSSSWFATAWFTYGLNLPDKMNFVKL